jgi:hypothetical protein
MTQMTHLFVPYTTHGPNAISWMIFILCPNVEWKSYNQKSLFISSIQAMERLRCALQQVSMILRSKAIVAWMIEDEAIHGARALPACTIRAFPKHFRAHQKADLAHSARWWALRDTYFNAYDDTMPIPTSSSQSRLGNRKRRLTKGATGRGQKWSEWMLWLYSRVQEDFDTYRKVGVKFSSKLLIELILSILLAKDSIYHAQSRDPKDDKTPYPKIHPLLNAAIYGCA